MSLHFSVFKAGGLLWLTYEYHQVPVVTVDHAP